MMRREMEKYAFLGWINKYTRPKQTKSNLDSINTLEIDKDCGSGHEEYDTQNNFRGQLNEPVANIPKYEKKPVKSRIKKPNSQMCNLA